MKKLLSLLFVILLLCLCTLAAAEEIIYTGTITGGKLNLRQSNSADSKSLGSYKAGTTVTILENDGTWCQVQVGGKTGYMMTEYLTITANYTHLDWVETKPDGTILTLREQADLNSPILLQVMSGVKAERIEKNGSFSRIRIGNTFGWVESNLLSPLDGTFETLMTSADSQETFDFSQLENAEKNVGSARMRMKEGAFPYNFQYPVLRIAEADEKIDTWLSETLQLFEQDFQANHPGETGSYTVRYKAIRIDERYASVLLAGQYTAGNTTITTFLPLNLDLQQNCLLSPDELFTQHSRLLFFIESHMSWLLNNPADGYTIKPESHVLPLILMGYEGLEVYLPAGMALPVLYGDLCFTLPYSQTAPLMLVDSQLIKSKIRTIDPTKPMIALTFDDGPSEHTLRILRVLAKYDARATFCVQGYNVETYPEIVKLAVAQGHEIASHTWSHPNLTEISASRVRSQLQRTNDIVAQVADGYQIKVLRPPYGATNKNVRSICADMDMIIAHWQIDTLDWEHRNANKTYKNIVTKARPGAIILCHDIYENTAIGVEKAIPELIEQGYQLVTVSELMSFHKDGAKPGTVYSHLDPKNIKMD